MLDTALNLKGLEVYTPSGILVGTVDEIIMDVPKMCAYGLFIKNVNPVLAEKNISISVPYRWVMSVGDVIILSAFPEKKITVGN